MPEGEESASNETLTINFENVLFHDIFVCFFMSSILIIMPFKMCMTHCQLLFVRNSADISCVWCLHFFSS